MRQRLDRLVAEGADVCDLDGWTDHYGTGIVEDLERRTAEILGKPSAAFFPTGTMAQQIALRVWAERTGNRTVAMHPMAHPLQHERDALTRVAGLRPLRTADEPSPPSADEIRHLDEPFGILHYELPLREAGFLLPEWEELVAVVDAARERDAVVHFDGARIWESTAFYGRPLPEIAGLADSVYVSFYKSLGGLSGAALAGPVDVMDEARAWRHRYGGLPFQQWPAALAALVGLDRELPRLPEYVAHARLVAAALARGLAKGPGWYRVHPEVPHTHEFQVWLAGEPEALERAAVLQAEETGTALFRSWRPGPVPGLARTELAIRAPGLAWSEDDVQQAVADFLTRVEPRE
ncbi:beta-eliminating lyase-related protein [Streptomyces sp. B6B3]|uniref:threonine aldolase family protein n=1 Tax=Streptomyces sp. B6B3 TaxID=3153570 RepID=UPI00325DF8A7